MDVALPLAEGVAELVADLEPKLVTEPVKETDCCAETDVTLQRTRHESQYFHLLMSIASLERAIACLISKSMLRRVSQRRGRVLQTAGWQELQLSFIGSKQSNQTM